MEAGGSPRSHPAMLWVAARIPETLFYKRHLKEKHVIRLPLPTLVIALFIWLTYTCAVALPTLAAMYVCMYGVSLVPALWMYVCTYGLDPELGMYACMYVRMHVWYGSIVPALDAETCKGQDNLVYLLSVRSPRMTQWDSISKKKKKTRANKTFCS